MGTVNIKESGQRTARTRKRRILPYHARRAYMRTRQYGVNLTDAESNSESQYAADHISQLSGDVIEDVSHEVASGVRWTARTVRGVYERGKRSTSVNWSGGGVAEAVESGGSVATTTAPENPRTFPSRPNRRVNSTSSRFYPKAGSNGPAARQAAHKAAIRKRAKQTAHSVQAMRTATQTTKEAVRRVSDAASKAVKAIISGTQALVTAVAAGGWVAIVIVVIICLVGMVVGSCFGIFFSSEDTGSTKTMREVVQQINDEYVAALDQLKASVAYDELEMSGARAVWPEVLAIYAVKTTTDPDNPQEVASLSDEKIQLLKDIFWQMNIISNSTAVISSTEIIESDDGNGNIVEEEVTITNTWLYITVDHLTAEEMASELGFDDDQIAQMEALLAEENNRLWTAVLYGIVAVDGQIVTVALSQVGNVGGEPYWSWYGFESRVEWCACFVSWCANECGYIEMGVIPKFSRCIDGVQWFQDRAQWLDSNAKPEPGSLIFFDWDATDAGGQDGLANHVGIVEKVENGRVYTIEGNSGDACKLRSYPLGYYEILGYGVPAY